MSRKIILIKQELLLLVYELNRSGLLAENEKIRPILAQLERSEERFSRNAETDLVCRLLLEKKKTSSIKTAPRAISSQCRSAAIRWSTCRATLPLGALLAGPAKTTAPLLCI